MKLAYLAFAFLWTLVFMGEAPAVTVDEMLSGKYAEEGVEVYPNSVTTCTGEGVWQQCINRSVEPEPRTGADCPEGEIMVTLRKYGMVSRQCVPE